MPVQYDKIISRDNVVDACQDAGLVPLCQSGKEGQSRDCLIMDLDNGRNDTWQLIREVCPDVEWKGENQGPKQICPKIEGVFFYAMNVSDKRVVNSSLGVLTKAGEAETSIWGSYWTSGKQLKPYYAACGKTGGNDERSCKVAFKERETLTGRLTEMGEGSSLPKSLQ